MYGKRKQLRCAVLAACVAFCLAGCGSSRQAQCSLKKDGSEIRLVLSARADYVTAIRQTMTVPLASHTADEITMAKGAGRKYEKRYKSIDGVTYKFDSDDRNMTETITVDASKGALQEVVDQDLLPVKLNSGRLPFEKTVDKLKKEGWTAKVS